jgi:hypothetical protein
VNHWGQRKLLLSEIEFLTLHGEPGALIVYAGMVSFFFFLFLNNCC